MLLRIGTKKFQCLVWTILNQQQMLASTAIAALSRPNCRCVRTSLIAYSKPTDDLKSEGPKRHKSSSDKGTSKNEPGKVFLLGKDDENLGFWTLADAEKLAKTKGLKLVKLEDPRGKRTEVYQLLTGARLHEERMKLREKKRAAAEKDGTIVNKGEKLMVIGSKIDRHDLGVKIKTMQKWLGASHVVRVNVTHVTSETEGDKIYSAISEGAEEVGGQALQKRFSSEGGSLRFVLQLSKKKMQQKAGKAEGTELAKESQEES